LKVEKGSVTVSFSDMKFITPFGINYRNDNNVSQVVELISTVPLSNTKLKKLHIKKAYFN